KALELDPRPRTSPQQAVGRLTQSRPALRRILGESGVESGKKHRNVSVYALTQGSVDERPAVARDSRLRNPPERCAVYPLPVRLLNALRTRRGTQGDAFGRVASRISAVGLLTRFGLRIIVRQRGQ